VEEFYIGGTLYGGIFHGENFTLRMRISGDYLKNDKKLNK
jgi:hypothetical protein